MISKAIDFEAALAAASMLFDAGTYRDTLIQNARELYVTSSSVNVKSEDYHFTKFHPQCTLFFSLIDRIVS